MIPVLIGSFCAGAASLLGLAWACEKRLLWVIAFIEWVIAFHELSFAFRGTREWIRVDLLLSLPAFTLGNLLLAWWAWRKCAGWWVYGLAGSAVAGPLWLALGR